MQQVVAALIGLVVGAAAAWIKAVLAIRGKVFEELRGRRLAVYPIVWRETAKLSFWPPANLTREDLRELNLNLRIWYFTQGGMYLSAGSRDRYGELKQFICLHLDRLDDREGKAAAEVSREIHDVLAETCSAFRNSLTEDLETRRQRSVWWVFTRWRAQRRRRKKWEERWLEAGGPDHQIKAYPLSEMPLPQLEAAVPPKET